jgi:hypothetical protein
VRELAEMERNGADPEAIKQKIRSYQRHLHRIYNLIKTRVGVQAADPVEPGVK